MKPLSEILTELKKDKKRLDWLLKELDEVLYGEVTLETREEIDEAMKLDITNNKAP